MVELVPDLFIAHRPSYTQSIRELDDDASDSSEPNLKELARVSGIEMNLNKNRRPSVQKTIIHPSMYPLYTPGCCWKRDNCYCYTYTVYMFCWFRHQFLMTEMKTTWLCWGGSFLDSRGTFQLSWDVTEVLPCRTTELQNLLTAVLRVLEGEEMVWIEDFERRLGQILDLVNRGKPVVVEDYKLGNRRNQPKEEYHEINPYNDLVRLSSNKK